MKIKIVFAAMMLSGCAQSLVTPVSPQGNLTQANGNIAYVNRTSQVSTESLSEGEKYLQELKLADKRAHEERMKIESESESTSSTVEEKCKIVTAVREQVLYTEFMNNPTNKTYNDLSYYRNIGKYSFYEKCVKLHKR